MPFIVTFAKALELVDKEQYINDCCIGGDIVLKQLAPGLTHRYGHLVPTQEDWGWFLWFEHQGEKLAVDVHTQDHTAGEFQIHLTARKPRFLLSAKVLDTPELENLKSAVVERLRAWEVAQLAVVRADERYNPVESAA